MGAWTRAIWEELRSSLAFVPSLALLIGVFAGLVMPLLEGWLQPSWPTWLLTDPEAARATLGAVAGALATVAGVVFSMTLVTLTLTASNIGPRLIRGFMRQWVPRLTLGLLLGSSAFSVIVLRAASIDADLPPPHVSVNIAVLLFVLSMLMVIAFVHTVTNAIQAHNVAGSVAREVKETLDRLCTPGRFRWEDATEDPLAQGSSPLHARQDGFIQAIDLERLIEAATERDAVLYVTRRPGDFVATGQVLARVSPVARADASFEAVLDACIVLGAHRTALQDVLFGVHQLVEIAVRAMSPGINDPVTAMACIDHLGACLRHMAPMRLPGGWIRVDGDLRVGMPQITFEEALDAAFVPIRNFAGPSAAVHSRLLRALATIAESIRLPERAALVRRHADRVLTAGHRALLLSEDADDLRPAHQRVLDELAAVDA